MPTLFSGNGVSQWRSFISMVFLLGFLWIGVLLAIVLFGRSFFPSLSAAQKIPLSNIGYSGNYDIPIPNGIDDIVLTNEMNEKVKSEQKIHEGVDGDTVKKIAMDGDMVKRMRESQYDRLVIMVIDAMRFDFLLDGNMEFVKSLIQKNQAYPFLTRAEAPTVTMPRIKALMSGIRPSFLDILFNVSPDNISGNPSFMIDNLLSRFHAKGKKIELYGDNTWEKLFSKEMFSKSDPTTSLFVHDTVTVDLNVSRHLDDIFIEQPSWDVVILHYLGLDHIGHVDGAHSSLMKPKQEEMDLVVKQIYEWLLKHDDTLFLLCSDHGMVENGNHGGASDEETGAFALFTSQKISAQGFPKDPTKVYEVKQVDIVPTIAMLFHLGIPKFSMGKIIEPLFANGDVEFFTHALRANVEQLYHLLGCNYRLWKYQVGVTEYGNTSLVNETDIERIPRTTEMKDLVDLYLRIQKLLENKQFSGSQLKNSMIEFLINASNLLHRESSNFDDFGLQCSMIVLAIISVCSFFISFMKVINFEIRAKGGYILSFLVLMIHIAFQFSPETKIFDVDNLFVTVVLSVCSAVCMELLTFMFQAERITLSESGYPWKGFIFLAGLLAFSSSFIEEAHSFYYYTGATMLLYLYYSSRSSKLLLILFLLRLSQSWNQAGIKYSSEMDVHKFLKNKEESCTSTVCRIVTMSPLILSIVTFLFHYIYQVMNVFKGKRIWKIMHGVCFISMSLCAIAYHLKLPFFSAHTNKFTFPQVFYGLGLIVFFLSHIQLQKGVSLYVHGLMNLFFMFQLLLQAPSNSLLVLMLYFQCHLGLLLNMRKLNLSPRSGMFLFSWLGTCCFYTFGQSISISNIDFSNGYIGFSSFQPVIVAIFTLFINYAGPIAWYFVSLITYLESESSFINFAMIHLELKSFVLLTTCLILYIQKSHLFVWSVFSPNFIFVVFDTCLYSMLSFGWLIFSLFHSIWQ